MFPGSSVAAGRWIARAALTVGALFLAVHVLLPLAGGLRRTASAVTHAGWWLLPVALVLEAASLASYAELQLTVMRAAGARPPRRLIVRSITAATALAKTMPGGSATGIVLTVELLGRNGLGRAQAASGVAATGAISWAVLAVTVPLASGLAIAAGATGGVALGSAVLTLAVLAGAALAPLGLRRPEGAGAAVARALRRVLRGPLRRLADPDVLGAAVTEAMRAAAAVSRRPAALAAAAGWAAANWLLDMAVLVAAAALMGGGRWLWSVPLVYALCQLLTLVPVTPGAVGILEATMTGLLVGAGARAAVAAAAVLGWRLVNHWLVIPVGLACIPGLRSGAAGGGTTRAGHVRSS